jgi:hypothetical protein
VSKQAVSIDKALIEKLKSIQGVMPGRTINSLAEQCVDEMLTMVEQQPDQREIPKLVRLVDSLKKTQKFADQEVGEALKRIRENNSPEDT